MQAVCCRSRLAALALDEEGLHVPALRDRCIRSYAWGQSFFNARTSGKRCTSAMKVASKGEILSLLQARAIGNGMFRSVTDRMTTCFGHRQRAVSFTHPMPIPWETRLRAARRNQRPISGCTQRRTSRWRRATATGRFQQPCSCSCWRSAPRLRSFSPIRCPLT